MSVYQEPRLRFMPTCTSNGCRIVWSDWAGWVPTVKSKTLPIRERITMQTWHSARQTTKWFSLTGKSELMKPVHSSHPQWQAVPRMTEMHPLPENRHPWLAGNYKVQGKKANRVGIEDGSKLRTTPRRQNTMLNTEHTDQLLPVVHSNLAQVDDNSTLGRSVQRNHHIRRSHLYW